jgi:GT2 family glycosyltransferase
VIPALAVPVLNRPDLLDRLLSTLHYEIGTLLVIDNGDVVKSLPHIPGVHRSHLLKMPSNLGVPGSWNLAIKTLMPTVPWLMIVNSDAYFPRTTLNRLAAAWRYDALVLSAASPPWACFMLGDQVVSRVGLFDESIYPAYHEDRDYERRCTHAGVPVVQTNIAIGHDNSSTIGSSQHYRSRNDSTYQANTAYYEDKVRRGDFTEGRWSLATRRENSWD